MPLLSIDPGTPVRWTIGRANEMKSVWPGRLVKTYPGVNARTGRTELRADIIVQRATQDGELYLDAQNNVSVDFLLNRRDQVDALDKVTLVELVYAKDDQTVEYLTRKVEAASATNVFAEAALPI